MGRRRGGLARRTDPGPTQAKQWQRLLPLRRRPGSSETTKSAQLAQHCSSDWDERCSTRKMVYVTSAMQTFMWPCIQQRMIVYRVYIRREIQTDIHTYIQRQTNRESEPFQRLRRSCRYRALAYSRALSLMKFLRPTDSPQWMKAFEKHEIFDNDQNGRICYNAIKVELMTDYL